MHFSIVSVDMGFFLLDPGRRNCSLLLPLPSTGWARAVPRFPRYSLLTQRLTGWRIRKGSIGAA